MRGAGRKPAVLEALRSLKLLFPRCVLLITDEIRMVGAQLFTAASIRPVEAKSNHDIIGGMGVILCGDSPQLRHWSGDFTGPDVCRRVESGCEAQYCRAPNL